MLPPDRYEQACRLFCRILRRLEERDKRNEQYQEDSTTGKDRENNIIEHKTINGISLSSVSPCEHPRTEE